MIPILNGYKTYIVCAVTIAYVAVHAWQSGSFGQDDIYAILAALGVGGLRSGIAAGK